MIFFNSIGRAGNSSMSNNIFEIVSVSIYVKCILKHLYLNIWKKY